MELEEKTQAKRERVLAGAVGAFLGSVLGVITIVILGQMGYVASISGLIMAICAVKGYELLGGGLSKKGAVIAGVMVLVMTYVGNRMDWALTVAQAMDVGIFEAFRAIDPLLEAGVIDAMLYWGNLALLYLFTLAGAVPTILGGLRAGFAPVLPSQTAAVGAAEGPRELTVYPAQKGWMRGLRASILVAMLVPFAVALAALWLVALLWGNSPVMLASAGAGLSFFLFVFALLPKLELLQADQFLMVRDSRGTLWRVALNQLNLTGSYRFTKKNGVWTALQWGKLTPEEQTWAKNSMARAIDDLSSGRIFPGNALGLIVIPLPDLELVKEDPWRWQITYQTAKGPKKRSIPKAYEGLRLAPDAGVAEGPVPFRWAMLAIALVFALVGALAGGLFGLSLEDGPAPLSGAAQTQQIPMPAPAQVVSHTLDGVTYEVSAAYTDQGAHRYLDKDTGAIFNVSVLREMDENSAVSRLIKPVANYRNHPEYKTFRFYQTDDTWGSLTNRTGTDCRYNILTVDFTSHRREYTGVAVTPEGVLLAVDVSHPKKADEAAVRSAILHMLESMEVEDTAAGPGMQVELTEENYQSFFQPAQDLGYSYVGRAYYRAPAEMFGYDAFLDALLPYGELAYSEDGRTVSGTAHGLRVRQATTYSEAGAAAVVDAAYQAMVDAGTDIYEDGVFDTVYDAEQDIAYKKVYYFEEDYTKIRMDLLYADIKQEHYYLTARITYLTDLIDDETPNLVAELSDAFGLSLPNLPAM